MKTMVVAPMAREARAVRGGAIALGAGEQSGERLREIIAHRRLEAIVIAGICGGLDPSLATGDVIVSRSVISIGGDELIADQDMLQAARSALGGLAATQGGRRAGGFVSSRLLSVEAPTTSRRGRCDLWNRYGAGGVDMETYALAKVAVAHGIRWLAVRVVADPSGARMPRVIASWRSEADDQRVAWAIARRPWQWPSALRLAWETRTALRSLTPATAAVVEALERWSIAPLQARFVNAAVAGPPVPLRR